MIAIVQGGQTGVDRGAHVAARTVDWPVGGWMPQDGRDERGPIPPDVAQHLWLCPRPGKAERTRENVRSSRALLVMVRDKADAYATPGTVLTLHAAFERNLPCRVVDPHASRSETALWIWNTICAPQECFFGMAMDPRPRLMVAGPRESRWPGAQAATTDFLLEVARRLAGQGAIACRLTEAL